MESALIDEAPPAVADNIDQQNTKSAENFQTFIYDLFDQNGILNDLRAYLRGHIVNVLKSAQTGDPLPCQKHFAKRLELANQALNILVAEYLLHEEFNYSLSVFVSEIPLANMVFAFAKTLMLNKESDHENLKFIEHDIWRILNYLGMKCDSEHIYNIIDMYKSEGNPPLLLCILKCMPLYNGESHNDDPANSSEVSTTSSVKSSDSHGEKHAKVQKKTSNHDKCKHYIHCKTCQNKVHSLKEKYRAKKRNFAEMFQQLKTVYEAEVDMLKSEEEHRIRSSVANHAVRLQKQRDEMEERFKGREEELERNVQQKKKFLWGLARALREQHAHMMRAMHDVKTETMRLTAKEDSLKTQLIDAERLLKKRGEEMRNQISNELVILENHLESMKQERDNINKERTELEKLKNITESNSKLLKIHNIDSEEVKNHYELLKNEFTILKKYIKATKLQPKCVIERSTLTDLNDISSKISVTLNNSHEVGYVRNDDGKLRSSQVVNDLKKQKNVNFSQSPTHPRCRPYACIEKKLALPPKDPRMVSKRSSASSEAGDANYANPEDPTLRHLNEENERLKTFARQQREHIDELLSERARLQAELAATQFRAVTEPPYWRPRTAPTVMPRHNYYVESSASATPASSGWRLGAGEELSLFSDAHPRVLLPGDELPFIGVLKDRHHDYRRRLINQWRILRRRFSPLAANSKTKIRNNSDNETTPIHIQDDVSFITNGNEPLETPDEMHPSVQRLNAVDSSERPKTTINPDVEKHREKSPKSIIREAKPKLNKQDTPKDQQPQHSREKSPNSVLREAKLRLRKLEIEAEAVEQSYFEFKKRQSQVKEKRTNLLHSNESVTKDIVDAKQRKCIEKLDDKNKQVIPSLNKDVQQLAKIDFEKYLKEYKAKLQIGETHFKNRDTAAVKVKPIPETYRNIDNVINKKNYLETPLNEFRKLYNSTEKPLRIRRTLENQENRKLSPKTPLENSTHCCKDLLKKAKDNKGAELEILKKNISKIYNLNEAIVDNSVEKHLRSPLSNHNDHELKNPKPNQIELECSLKLDTSKPKFFSSPVTHSFDSELKSSVELEYSSNLKTNTQKIVSRKLIGDENVPRVNVKNVSEVIVVDDNQSEMLAVINSVDNRDAQIGLDSSLIPKTNNKKLESPKSIVDKNSPRVDVEGISEVNVVDDTQNEILAVNNSINNRDGQESDVDEIRPKMTIIVSPKIPKDTNDRSLKSHRSVSPEQAAKLTRNDVLDAIFQKEGNDQISSIQMQLELSNDVLENSVSDLDKEEYRDDFSADVDNYNSRSEYENEIHSPVSILKTSEDENFWES
ncbi:hypothetical protein K1T71_011881 [Dendrolimus kikuchii]|uniref:Uncharacterized protein n=1 Tax=Dendrolimus kikuchii TaxID=765133 RepID=A0ACC1CME2_9NEOP|nr:hypothetical protein K1T71_011881 [Dendrolimus kikuchii]